mgnify:CR=1 FL=1
MFKDISKWKNIGKIALDCTTMRPIGTIRMKLLERDSFFSPIISFKHKNLLNCMEILLKILIHQK